MLFRKSLHAVSMLISRCSISTHFFGNFHTFVLCSSNWCIGCVRTCALLLSLSHKCGVLQCLSSLTLAVPLCLLSSFLQYIFYLDLFFEYFVWLFGSFVCLSVVFVCWFLLTRLGACDAHCAKNWIAVFYQIPPHFVLHCVLPRYTSIVSKYPWEGKWIINKLVCLIPQLHFIHFISVYGTSNCCSTHLTVCKLSTRKCCYIFSMYFITWVDCPLRKSCTCIAIDKTILKW